METVSINQAFAHLSSAILARVLDDVKHRQDLFDCIQFAGSDYCEELCDYAGVSVDKFREAVAVRFLKAVELLKPKRIKTQMIAEALRNGKNTTDNNYAEPLQIVRQVQVYLNGMVEEGRLYARNYEILCRSPKADQTEDDRIQIAESCLKWVYTTDMHGNRAGLCDNEELCEGDGD